MLEREGWSFTTCWVTLRRPCLPLAHTVPFCKFCKELSRRPSSRLSFLLPPPGPPSSLCTWPFLAPQESAETERGHDFELLYLAWARTGGKC